MKLLTMLSTGVLLFLSVLRVNAQEAKEVLLKINKQEKPAYTANYKVSKKLMKKTLDERFAKAGFTKSSKYKGYRKYEGVTFTELAPNKVDIYTKIEGKKTNSTVFMLVSSGYDNFMGNADNPAVSTNAIAFLNKLSEDAVATQAAIDLAAQQAALKAAEDKLKSSDREAKRLAEKKAKLEKKLDEENKTGSKASQEVEAEKLRLENLKNPKTE